MCSSEENVFEIKTEPPEDIAESLFTAGNMDFDMNFMSSPSFPTGIDYFKDENLLEDSDFPLLQPKIEPGEVIDEPSLPAMVEIPAHFLDEIKPEPLESKVIICDECDEEIESPKEYEKHHRIHKKSAKVKKRLQHPKTKERKCRKCNQEFPTFNELVNHFLTHYNLSIATPPKPAKKVAEPSPKTHKKPQVPRRHICSVCGLEFPTISPLVQHFLSHQNLKLDKKPEPAFACPECPYKGASMSRLKQHRETHLEVPPAICPTCQKSFRTQKLMEQHISRQHVKIECKECGQVFMKRNDMVEHYLKHFDLTLKPVK